MRTLTRPLAVLVALAATAASAQYTGMSGYSYNNPVSASIDGMLWSRMNSRLIYRMMLKKRGYTDAQLNPMRTEEMERILGGAPKAQEVARQPPATRFKMGPKRLVLGPLAASLTKDRAQQAALVTVFESGLVAYEQEAAKDKLNSDVAGSIAFLIGSSYMLVHDGQEPDENGITMLARQLQQVLDTPEMRKVADTDKQKFHELLVGLGTWMLVAWQQAVKDGDAATQATLKSTAGDVLKGYLKLEPGQYRITANGLEVTK